MSDHKRLMYFLIGTVAAFLLIFGTGCAPLKGERGEAGVNGTDGSDGSNGSKGDQGLQGPTPLPVVVSPQQEQVNSLVLDENEYRLGLGQATLSSGLSCTLYTFTSGDRIQSSIAGHNTLTGYVQVATYLFKSTFNQPDAPGSDGSNLLPLALRLSYLNLYMVRCQGNIVTLETSYYNFDAWSDDASVLYIDDTKVVDNDNAHGITLASGQKYMRRGVHKFRLDYAQSGGGNQAMVLKMNGQLIDSLLLYH